MKNLILIRGSPESSRTECEDRLARELGEYNHKRTAFMRQTCGFQSIRVAAIQPPFVFPLHASCCIILKLLGLFKRETRPPGAGGPQIKLFTDAARRSRCHCCASSAGACSYGCQTSGCIWPHQRRRSTARWHCRLRSRRS